MSLARVVEGRAHRRRRAPRARRERASASRALAPARGFGFRRSRHPGTFSANRRASLGALVGALLRRGRFRRLQRVRTWTAPAASASPRGGSRSARRPRFVAPAGTSAFDADLIAGLSSAPFSGATNPIFEALFNSLGVVPAVYSALLLPGGKDQPRLKPNVPVAASFALGFFAGPT